VEYTFFLFDGYRCVCILEGILWEEGFKASLHSRAVDCGRLSSKRKLQLVQLMKASDNDIKFQPSNL